jgi:signal transduction histidine kinase/PAS domain-containing protein
LRPCRPAAICVKISPLDTYPPRAGDGEPDALQRAEALLRESERQRVLLEIALGREAEARAHAEEKYQTLFDTIAAGLAIVHLIRDASGKVVDARYLEVNDAFEHHTGWKNARGKRRSEIAPIPDDDWLVGCDRVVQTGEPERWEAYSRNAKRWYRCFLSRVGGEGSDLIALIFENITGRKNRERNRALLTAVTDELAGLEKVPDTMRRVGERIARHFEVPWCVIGDPGPDPEGALARHGWNAPDVPPIEESCRIRDLLAGDVLSGEPWVVRDILEVKGVSTASYLAAGIRSFVTVPLVRNRACRCLLSVCDRVVRAWSDDEVELLRELGQRICSKVERAHAEEALRHSEAQLRQVAAELKEADRRKNDFLAMLGHELRNPLAAIRSGILLMRSEKAKPESREAALQIVAEQVAHVERLVDDLLDLTRIVQGNVQLRREKMALQDALRQSLEMLRPQAEPAGFTIEVQVPSEPLEVYGDRVRLTQVFMNVLGNAVKYSGDSRLIEVSATRDGDSAVVRVRDHGLGIPPEVLPRIFEPFVQAKPGVTLQAGLGLGLAVVRQLIRLHDGEVEATSAGENRGSELVLRLPLSRVPEERTTMALTIRTAVSGGSG